jgi:flagella basal body P-ring formation protein FlgA
MNFNAKISFSVFIFINLVSTMHVFGAERIDGYAIKKQAEAFFQENGLDLTLSISDNRTFFPCPVPLTFKQRQQQDWNTITVSCGEDGWSRALRTVTSFGELENNKNNNNFQEVQLITLVKNLTKGDVILEDHLKIEYSSVQNAHGSFNNMVDVIGRKTRSNLASGTILKARHLETSYSVNKNDNVLVVAGNRMITITTAALALEEGQIGDMISVKNINSEKIFKVIITGKKKVAPITNM